MQGYTGDDGLATDATLREPHDCAVASDGTVLIADYGNNVVRSVNPTTQFITTVAGTG